MNISDSERVADVLESANYKSTPDISKADLVAVVMCSVRQSAVNRVHGLVDNLNKIKKKPVTILTGCVLKKDKKKFENLFDYIFKIDEIIDLKRGNELFAGPGPLVPAGTKGVASSRKKNLLPSDNKFSALIPIMTGCNNFCSYCVVPYVRGREISRPAKEIIYEIKNLVKKGYKEIWLLGQNVNSYKSGKTDFPRLLRMVDKIPGSFWIRFTSSHPKDFSDQVISAMAECKKVTPYLNLPVQSGDDRILKLMNRHYTVKDYKNKIAKLRKKIPNICLSTDIIVGFPGETKKQFENTARLMREIKYDMAYINKYSPRAETAAAKMKDNIPIEEKKRREKVLNEILKQTALENNKKYIGREVEVLNDRTKEYKNILAKKAKLGKFAKVKVTGATPWRMTAN